MNDTARTIIDIFEEQYYAGIIDLDTFLDLVAQTIRNSK